MILNTVGRLQGIAITALVVGLVGLGVGIHNILRTQPVSGDVVGRLRGEVGRHREDEYQVVVRSRFTRALDYVLASEGGYSNHKADSGGPTHVGISLKFLQSIDADDADINGDDRVDTQDIKSMTIESAAKLYKKYFYKPCRIDDILDEKVAVKFFDMAVNLGPYTAIKLLQDIVGVQKTGKVGLTTLEAINRADGPQTLKQLQMAQETHYRVLVLKKPSQKVFLDGWLKRARRVPGGGGQAPGCGG